LFPNVDWNTWWLDDVKDGLLALNFVLGLFFFQQVDALTEVGVIYGAFFKMVTSVPKSGIFVLINFHFAVAQSSIDIPL
jgi:hypothetical protein